MSWRGIEFAQPGLLMLVLLAPLAYLLLSKSAGSVVFSSFAILPASAKTWRTRLAWLPYALVAVGVALLAVAAAGPRRGIESAKVRREGIAIVAAVDTSGSMLALDLSPPRQELTRLDAVKNVFERFVLGDGKLRGRGDDAIGLVAFARYADTKSPLTLDHGNLVTAIRATKLVTDREEDGTAIGAGLALAVERLRSFQAKSKVLILLTDGVQNHHEISVDAAVADAKASNIKVYTIGAGTKGIAPIRIPLEDGSTVLRQVEVEIDEETLRDIAAKTGGQYFRATDHASLAEVYKQIDGLERSKIEDTKFSDYRQLFGGVVVIALVAMALGLLLAASWFRRVP